MNVSQKYDLIRDMKSIGSLTANEYPSFEEFRQAVRQGRVSGDYDKRIVIVSNNPRENYTFVTE